MRRTLATVLAAAAALACAPAARVEDYLVGGTADVEGMCTGTACASLRQALASAAQNPGPDTVSVPAGSYDVTLGPLKAAGDVTVNGASARTTSVGGVLEVDGTGVSVTRVKLRSLRNEAGSASLDRVRVSGDGVVNRAGTLVVENSLVDHNPGAGIVNLGALAPASLTVPNSTVAFNAGGGIASSGNPLDALSLQNATVARNAGAGFSVETGATAGASVIADNSTVNCAGAVVSTGFNVESGNDCGFGVHDTPALLGAALENLGGDTDVLRLLRGSPALDV